MNKSFNVIVPGTSANMGPGFDSMGLALNLYNIYKFEKIESGIELSGFDEGYNNLDNILYKAMKLCFEKANYKISYGIKISEIKRDIPVSRGLGSSSALIVAGIFAANRFMDDLFSLDDLLDLAVLIEGHPDNVAPAILGGIVIASVLDKKTYYQKVVSKNDYKYIAIVPRYELKTDMARSILPKTVEYSDAIYNISRVGLLVSGLINGDDKAVNIAMNDRLHEPFRKKFIKGFDLIKEEAYNNKAIASFLSGAGPTIMILAKSEDLLIKKMRDVLNKEKLTYNILDLNLDMNGVLIEGGN
ncbi:MULTISPECIES: homoserine kinase [Clostridium]|uniref:homoserine kinase n=1 Tax=Clostridium TaxID=1485 RepID=UPI0021527844|nr:homoserine kinase [Clostridium sp. LY3-2]MCR6515679.1 homoserine kinase [Clostridium sp. LY3-2]